jgi:diamine N-acetyltransferase
MSITLQPVTAVNWEALINLTVRDGQSGFVGSNLFSIAESQFGFEYEGRWNLHPFGIFDDKTPAGFVMYGYNFSHFRLMVDTKYQGKGYGRLGMVSSWRISEQMNGSRG